MIARPAQHSLIDELNKTVLNLPEELKLSLAPKIEKFFNIEDQKLIKIPLPEALKLHTCHQITRNTLVTLNHLKHYTADLGYIDLNYNLPIDQTDDVSTLMYTIPRSSKEVDTIVNQYRNNNFNTTELLSSEKILYGIFKIHLFLGDRIGRGPVGHTVSGYVDKQNKSIIIYDGASWINFDHGTAKLKEYFKKILPDYSLNIIAKHHQTLYGTCSMFQPAVVYLMLLFGKDTIINLLDSMSSAPELIERLIDNAVIDLFNYTKIMTPVEDDKPFSPKAITKESYFFSKEKERLIQQSPQKLFYSSEDIEKGEQPNHDTNKGLGI